MKQLWSKNSFIPLVVSLLISLLVTSVAAATTVYVLDGDVSVTDSVGTGSVSDGVVTITVKSSTFSRKTNTVTITNESGNTATVSFDYTLTTDYLNSKTFPDNKGSISEVLGAGSSLSYDFEAKAGNRTVTLTLENFNIVAAAASSNVTINYNSSLGSVTIDGAAVSSGAATSLGSTSAHSLVASPVSGATFLGWVDGDGKLLSSSTTYSFTPTEDTTIEAIFTTATSNAWFMVGSTTTHETNMGALLVTTNYVTYYTVAGNHYFDDLAAAVTFATQNSYNAIVLASTGVLPEGNYNIPNGVTLLIPFDSSNTMYTTKAGALGEGVAVSDAAEEDVISTPSVYRKLTMQSGAHITVASGGGISVSGQHGTYQGHNGAPSGPQGYIDLQTGSSITVNGGLYAWGYITGSGSVTMKTGSSLYEYLQIADWPGGDAAVTMANDKKVFPFSQYYVQNVLAPLTMEAGSIEKVQTSVSVTLNGVQSMVETLVGSDSGMFRISSGSFTRTYNGATDRISYSIDGDIALANLKVAMKVSVEASLSIDSVDFYLPINCNVTLDINSGTTTVANDVVLLPGTQMNVESSANVVLGSGAQIVAFDKDEWSTFCAWQGGNHTVIPARHVPGRTKTRTASDLVDVAVRVDGVLDAHAGYLYSTAGGANVYSTEHGQVITTADTSDSPIINMKTVSGTNVTYVTRNIFPVKLLNADKTFTETDNSVGLTYTYDGSKWISNAVASWDSMHYSLLSSATSAYVAAGATDFIQMLANTHGAETLSADSDVFVDLAGYTVTLNEDSTVSKVYFLDKSSDGFEGGTGRVKTTVALPDALTTDPTYNRNYVKVDLGSNTYAFPRVATAVTGVGYTTNGGYLTFQNTTRVSTAYAGKLTNMGFSIVVGENTNETWYIDGEDEKKLDEAPAVEDAEGNTLPGSIFRAHYTMGDAAVTSIQSLAKFNGIVVPSKVPTDLSTALTSVRGGAA